MDAQKTAAAAGAPRGSWLLTPSGGLLALCFFLPAVQVCGRPTAPYEAPGLFPPYLFGLLVALIGVLVARRRPVPVLLRWAAWLLASGGGGALCVGLAMQLVEAPAARPPVLTAALTCAAIGLTCALVALLRRGVTAGRRQARTLTFGGALTLLWCLLILSSEPRRNLLIGFWLTLASSLGVTASGLLLRGPEERGHGQQRAVAIVDVIGWRPERRSEDLAAPIKGCDAAQDDGHHGGGHAPRGTRRGQV